MVLSSMAKQWEILKEENVGKKYKDNYDTIGMPYGIFLNTYFYEEKGREVIEKCNSSGLTPECFDNIMWLKSKDCEEIK